MADMSKISIRKASEADLDALVKVNHEVWHSTYGSFYPADFVEEQTPETMRSSWERTLRDINPSLGWFVAEADGELVAYAGAGRVPDMGMDYRAELYSVCVLPSFQGKGVGLKLMGELSRFLQGLGADSLLGWIAKDNPYAKFYKKCGAKKLKHHMTVSYGGKAVEVGTYGWLNLDETAKL